ncbi:Hypothetical protein J6888_04711 [Nakaseomyces glabratus]
MLLRGCSMQKLGMPCTSARPYSQPSVVTRTVSESDGVVDTVVISYFPSVGEDGVTRTVTSTVSTITADYTTTVTSDGHTITEVVSHITTTDSAGEVVCYYADVLCRSWGCRARLQGRTRSLQ